MRTKYILPVVGQIYKNQNGREYCCLSNTSYPNEKDSQRSVELGEHQADMVRMSDGWSFTAHGLHQYEDGTVEWNYSTGGAFRENDLKQCQKMLRGKDSAFEKYFNYLDFLRMSGTINMFGAVPYLQQAFPELGSDAVKAREALRAWMDSFSARDNGDDHGNG